jgi:hypothetical protein
MHTKGFLMFFFLFDIWSFISWRSSIPLFTYSKRVPSLWLDEELDLVIMHRLRFHAHSLRASLF